MSQLILSRGNTSKKNILRRFFPGLRPGPYFLIGSLIACVVLTTVITLMFSTSQVTKGYVLNRLEATHQDLVKENEIHELQISKVRSLNYIKESSKVKYMVRPNQIVYVNGGDTAIASR